MVDKNRTLIAILVAVIAVLVVVVLYAFVVSPRLDGYVVQRQQEGIDFAVANIAQIAAQCRELVPLPIGQDENGQVQSINLVAVECFPDRFPELQQAQGQGNSGVSQEEIPQETPTQ